MSGNKEQYLQEIYEAACRVDDEQLAHFLDALEQAYRHGRSVFVIGNGGSAANASHFAQDLSKGTIADLEGCKRFRALSLTDSVAMLTALSNDIGYERVFDLQLRQFAAAGDILVAISGSGNSPNIIRAVEYARVKGLTVVGITGFDGGKLMPLSHIKVHVPLDDMCMSEAVHAILLHMTVDFLRERFQADDVEAS